MNKMKIRKVDVCENPYAYTVLQNLKDAGCTEDFVEKFMSLQENKDTTGQLKLLFSHRKYLLEQLHREERHIDCLDYLIYHMQSE